MVDSLLFQELRVNLTPLYICNHTKGLMSHNPCEQGCAGQTAMFREDDLRNAFNSPPSLLMGVLRDLEQHIALRNGLHKLMGERAK